MEMLLQRALDARRISPPPAQVLTAGHAPCCDTVAGVVGSTPVLWIDRPLNPEGRGFWAKLEGLNPGGIKDRAALHMVQRARERDDLPPGGMIIESTSGTLGLGLALAGITYGHPRTTWLGMRHWHGNSSPSWAGSMCWCARWAPVAIRPG